MADYPTGWVPGSMANAPGTLPLNSAGQFNGDFSALTPEQLSAVQAAMAQAQGMTPGATPTKPDPMAVLAEWYQAYGKNDPRFINMAKQLGVDPVQAGATLDHWKASYDNSGSLNKDFATFFKDVAGVAGLAAGGLAAGGAFGAGGGSVLGATGPGGIPTGAIGADAVSAGVGQVGATGAFGASSLLPGSGVLAPTTGIPATLGQSALTGAGLPADLGGAGSIATATGGAGTLAPGGGVLAPAGGAIGAASGALPSAGGGAVDAATGEASNTPLYGSNPPPNATPGGSVPGVNTGGGSSNMPDLSGAGSSGFQLSDLLKYIPDIVAGVGSVLGYQSQTDAAKEATAAQLKASEDQIAFARETRDKAIALQQPFHDAAVTAVGQLQGMTGAPGTTGPTPSALMAADPGYQFRLSEGDKAKAYGAAAGGYSTAPGTSGGFSKELTRYNQDYASGEYTSIYNRIANIAGLNQVSGPVQQSAYNSSIAPTTGAISDAGNASATGYAAQSNALQDLLRNFSTIIGGVDWAKIGSKP